MKRVLSALLALVFMISMVPAVHADYDDVYGEEIEKITKTVSGWKNVKQLYEFNGGLFAVTEKGKVLTTDERFKDCGKWSDVDSLCFSYEGEQGCVFAVCGSGKVMGLASKGAEQLADEVCGWKNVKELYSTGDWNNYGFCALCTDGSVRYTENLEEIFGALSGVKVKSLYCGAGNDGRWAAVTQKGRVLTNIEEIADDAADWKNVEKLWIVSRYDNVMLLGRRADGSTELEFTYEDDCCEDAGDVLEACRNISTLKWNYEDDWLVYLTDSGSAGAVYLADWGNPDPYGLKSQLKGIKNAVSVELFWYLEPENTGELLETNTEGLLLTFICSDGTVADIDAGGTTVSFEPEEPGAKITSIVSVLEDSAIFGLTEKGTVTRIHVMSGASKGGNAGMEGTPSAADLDAIGTGIVYPEAANYLDEYIHGVITPSKGKSGVYAYSKSHGGSKLRTLKTGEEVTVIAEEYGRYCIIVESLGKAYWVDSDYIE